MLFLKLIECVCLSRRVAQFCGYVMGVRSCLCVVSFTVISTLFVAAVVCCMFLLNGGGVSIVWHTCMYASFATDCFLLWYRVRLGIQLMALISWMCDVIYFYCVSIPFSMFSSVALVYTNKKYRSAVSTCFWFVVISAFGGGVVVTLALVIIKNFKPSFNVFEHTFVQCIVCGGNDGIGKTSLLMTPSTNTQDRNGSAVYKRKISSVEKENCTDGGQPPQKRGRPSKISSGHRCGGM